MREQVDPDDGAHAEAQQLHWRPNYPITPESIYVVLRDTVLKGKDALPASTDPVIERLANYLNGMRWSFKGWTGPWREDEKKIQSIVEAIRLLTEFLPQQREEYVTTLSGYERWHMTDAAGKARADLAAIDALLCAAQNVRARKLPLSNLMIAVSPQNETWMHYARRLQEIFQQMLPGRSKAAAYRFIVAVAPLVSGEEPTIQAVTTAFKKRRL